MELLRKISRNKKQQYSFEPFIDSIQKIAAKIGVPITHPLVQAFQKVDRSVFASEEFRDLSNYNVQATNRRGVTSLPTTMFLLTAAITPESHQSVLLIGTGSGYHTRILSELVAQVVSVEKDAQLSSDAQKRLAHEGVTNVQFIQGDGAKGWKEGGPYDAILFTAGIPSRAIDKFPQSELAKQLKVGGVCVAPTGKYSWVKRQVVGPLMGIQKLSEDSFIPKHFHEKSGIRFYFAPLVSDAELGFSKITERVYVPSHTLPARMVHSLRRRSA